MISPYSAFGTCGAPLWPMYKRADSSSRPATKLDSLRFFLSAPHKRIQLLELNCIFVNSTPKTPFPTLMGCLPYFFQATLEED